MCKHSPSYPGEQSWECSPFKRQIGDLEIDVLVLDWHESFDILVYWYVSGSVFHVDTTDRV